MGTGARGTQEREQLAFSTGGERIIFFLRTCHSREPALLLLSVERPALKTAWVPIRGLSTQVGHHRDGRTQSPEESVLITEYLEVRVDLKIIVKRRFLKRSFQKQGSSKLSSPPHFVATGLSCWESHCLF